MGASYKIRCEHCGTEFLHIVGTDLGTIMQCVGCETIVETDVAIRCPSCARRLNHTEEEFNAQIISTMQW